MSKQTQSSCYSTRMFQSDPRERRQVTYHWFGQRVMQLVRLLCIFICKLYIIRFVIKCRQNVLFLEENLFLTAHVGVVDDRFAPRAPAVVFVGAYAKLVGSVGFQVVDDGFAGWAGLVDPFPVPLSVADGVEPATRKMQITKDPRIQRHEELSREFLRVLSIANSPAEHLFHVITRVRTIISWPFRKIKSQHHNPKQRPTGLKVADEFFVCICGPSLFDRSRRDLSVLQLGVVNSGGVAETHVFQAPNINVWQQPNSGSKDRINIQS